MTWTREAQPAVYRPAVRWGVLLAAAIVAGWRWPETFNDYRLWRDAVRAGNDPSAIDAYRTFFVVDAAGALIVAAMAAGLFFLLRPRRGS